MDKKISKLNTAIACGLFPVILTANLSGVLSSIASTTPWVELGSYLVETMNFHLDEVAYNRISIVATAYSSTPDQTDSTPFTTAAGTEVRDGVIAANFLPFRTKIKIPEIYGEKIFIVEDRMNKRFNDADPPRIDIWKTDRHLAKSFGLKKTYIVVLD